MEPYINPQTGKEVFLVDRVLTFGLSEDENAFVGKHMPNKKCELMPTDFVTDLYAYRSFAVIIRAQTLSKNGVRELELFYRELENDPAAIIWIGEPKLSARIMRMIHYYSTWDALQSDLKSLLNSSYIQINEIRTMRDKLALAIRILRLIEQYPGIRSRALAESLFISRRSVQRTINLLRYANESVRYDASKHGWIIAPPSEPDNSTGKGALQYDR